MGFFPWNVRYYYTRQLPAASRYPRRLCIMSKTHLAWLLLCDFAFGPGQWSAGDKWSIGLAPFATSCFVRSPTNASPLSDWNVIGQPSLAIQTFFKWSYVSCNDAAMQRAASAYLVKGSSITSNWFLPVAVMQIFGCSNCTSSLIPDDSSVSGYTICPRPDDPSGRVSKTKTQFDTAVVVLSNCIFKGICFPLSACRPQSRLCLSLANPFSSCKIASKIYSCLFPITFVGCSVFYPYL